MAGVTYLVRMLPLVIFRGKIKNRFILSFLHYMPYAVLTVMTVPSMFFATGNVVSGIVGFIVALTASLFNRSLTSVALLACVSAYLTQLIVNIL